MNIIRTEAYRAAFVQYLRAGSPIWLSLKQARQAEQYVWRTQRDEKVRMSHRRNDGRIVTWADAPDTGHPGGDYNCRCEAVPYIEGQTEFAFHDFTTSLASSYDRWTIPDFTWHDYRGQGRSVTLLEIGHLREIAEHYAFEEGVEGAFRRLSDQIADEARSSGSGTFTYRFGDTYDFGSVAFPHGRGEVRGTFVGVADGRGEMLAIRGGIVFTFSDIFADPLDIGVEPGGKRYQVTGDWTTSFAAEVLKDRRRSAYFNPETPQ